MIVKDATIPITKMTLFRPVVHTSNAQQTTVGVLYSAWHFLAELCATFQITSFLIGKISRGEGPSRRRSFEGMACLLMLIVSVGCSQALDLNNPSSVSSSTGNTRAQERTPRRITFDLLKHKERIRVPPTSRTVPEEIRMLAGETVVVDGYCIPAFSLKRMFILEVTNILPADSLPVRYADESIAVTLADDWSGHSPICKIEVVGTFRIEDTYDEASREVILMYYLDNAALRKIPLVKD